MQFAKNRHTGNVTRSHCRSKTAGVCTCELEIMGSGHFTASIQARHHLVRCVQDMAGFINGDAAITGLRAITVEVYRKHRVLLTAVGVYSVNTSGDRAARLRDEIYALVKAHEHVLQLHGFYLNEEKKTVRFDVVISFDAGDRAKVYQDICGELTARYPEYAFEIALDYDFSEE